MNELGHKRIATRGSDLALWQAKFLQSELAKLDITSELEILKTKGDNIQNLSFDKIEGKGFFTKEIEEAVLDKRCDIAVHSMKDLPTEHHPDLVVAAVSARQNAFDCIVLKNKLDNLDDIRSHLGKGKIIGTSSARRKLQLRALFPEASIADIRGNVPTRIKKLDTEHYDAIILAKAGIERLKLDMSSYTIFQFDNTHMVPAPAQGVLAYQCRADDLDTQEKLKELNDPMAWQCSIIERTALNQIDGGCQTPFGAHCVKHKNKWTITIAYAKEWQSPMIKLSHEHSNPSDLAIEAIQKLKSCI